LRRARSIDFAIADAGVDSYDPGHCRTIAWGLNRPSRSQSFAAAHTFSDATSNQRALPFAHGRPDEQRPVHAE